MNKNILYGEPVSAGKTTGIAKVLYSRQDIKKVQEGDIIVSHRINPELALSMVNINGIITERGSLVCHAASIARELNIPAVIRVDNAKDYINDGDLLELDADKGIIKILFRKVSVHNSLYLIDKCNNNCIMCPLEFRKDFSMSHLTIKEIKKRIDLLPKTTTHLNISGGEPTLLKEELINIIKYCRTALPNTSISILTNARMFSYKGFASKLKKASPQKTEIVAAFHSFDKKTHETISGTKSFEQTVKGIKNLLDLGFEVEVRVVISKLNYKQLPKISEFISQEFSLADRVCFLYMELTGKVRENFQKLYVTYSDITSYLEQAGEILKKCHMHFRLYHFPLCVLKKEMRNFVWDSITEHKKANLNLCQDCILKQNCCGVFESYVALLGNKELKAIKNDLE
jgi:His-Xaa-Ser system radical SAM maturase HxsC